MINHPSLSLYDFDFFGGEVCVEIQNPQITSWAMFFRLVPEMNTDTYQLWRLRGDFRLHLIRAINKCLQIQLL